MARLRTSFWSNLGRKKSLSVDTIRSDLKRCLGLVDLTFLAIGSMVGSGLYVLTGTIAHSVSGPAVVISYIIAAVASGLSAICYAEFAARIPVTGSAYQFTYLSVGELWAFLIGWNVLIEYIVTCAAVAKSWSAYIDSATGYSIKHYLEVHAPMAGGGIIPDYPDLLAVGILAASTIVILSGAEMSSKFTTAFVIVNLIVVAVIVVCGFFLGDLKNWTDVEGGFFPFGFAGTISGAATLVFSYAGYEVIAAATEEAVNPNRDIPLSVFVGLSVVTIVYVGASASLTLMVPYYNISSSSPFPEAFAYHHWNWTRYFVSVGASAAMITALVTSLYLVPRYLLAMSRDGLLMKFFSFLSKKAQIPYISTIIGGAACMVFAIVFEVNVLIEFISIGQLLACTFVAICVVKLRYEPNSINRYMEAHPLLTEQNDTTESFGDIGERSPLNNNAVLTEDLQSSGFGSSRSMREPAHDEGPSTEYLGTSKEYREHEHAVGTVKDEILRGKYGHHFQWTTRHSPGTIPNRLIIFAAFCFSAVSAFLRFTNIETRPWWLSPFIYLFGFLSIASVTLLLTFYQDESMKTFKVPGVPFVPFVSAFLNIFLMTQMQFMTWVRLGIWIVVGLVVYFSYGYFHSKERRAEEEYDDD